MTTKAQLAPLEAKTTNGQNGRSKETKDPPKAAVSETIPSFQNVPTDDPHLFRVVDRNGDWQYYFQDELKRYLPSVNFVIANGFPKGQRFHEWLKNKSAAEADEILRSAGNRGSKVHAAIRDLIAGQEVKLTNRYENDRGNQELLTPEEWDILLSWFAWTQYFSPELIVQETAIATSKYAGTLDFLGTILLRAGQKYWIDDKQVTIKEDRQVRVLLDWKTSSGIWNEYRLQVSAYAMALDAKVWPEFTGIVRLGTAHKNGGYEMKLWGFDQTLYHYSLFLDAYRIYKLDNPTWEPDIVHQPTLIKVKIPLCPITPERKKPKSNSASAVTPSTSNSSQDQTVSDSLPKPKNSLPPTL